MAQAIGGQAVLEGVMMRGPRNWAVAVRKPDGDIAHVTRVIDPLAARHWTLRLPVVCGVVALGESLAIGFRALSVSANYAAQEAQEGDEEPAEIGRWALAFAFLVAIGFALMMFKVGPALLTDLLPISNGGWFVLVEGVIRVCVFVAYLTVLSFIPSLRRVFQYHAAEHKAINAYEAGDELTPEITQRYSLIHPRCGTAFLLWVMVVGVFVYALLGRPAWYWLIVSRIVLLPVIAGIAAAWASCFSMALSNGLAQDGNPPEKLETSATVTFQPGEGITRGALTVRGTVPGIDEAAFREAAETAKQNCPVSKALAGIPDVTVEANLAG